LFGAKSKKIVKKLWVVSELFYPEETSTAYLLTKIACALSEKYEVNVICGPAVYDTGKKSNVLTEVAEKISGMRIHRLRGLGINKNSSALLLSFQAVFLSLRMTWYLGWRVKKEDRVLMVTTPVFLLLFVSFLKHFKRFFWYVLVYDVFPENGLAAGFWKSSTGISYRFLKYIFDRAYSWADLLLVIGRDMKEVIQHKITRFHSHSIVKIIENWAETDLIREIPREKAGGNLEMLQNKIVIQYAGNMGRVQGLMELLEIIEQVENPNLRFYFVGSGALKNKMQEYVQVKKLWQVMFEGSYARKEQNQVLNNCDLSVITLAEGMYGLAVPSKSYNIMAAGKPILFIGAENSEVWKMVKENQIGFCFAPNNKQGIIRFFNELSFDKLKYLQNMGKKAREVAEKYYAERIILDRYKILLSDDFYKENGAV